MKLGCTAVVAPVEPVVALAAVNDRMVGPPPSPMFGCPA